ncbi:hypothetical protein [Pseudanabaena sp. PCC 6802]|uniref:hypothetical protein n=1 Tax=Pseudanabaena sp. PCC 6802 TaxID=118173 RepID=UPI000349938D|nr:hypothetical protein [Pseudanabaena sp. PCC 6802]
MPTIQYDTKTDVETIHLCDRPDRFRVDVGGRHGGAAPTAPTTPTYNYRYN